jgi:hypothetical protein
MKYCKAGPKKYLDVRVIIPSFKGKEFEEEIMNRNRKEIEKRNIIDPLKLLKKCD